MLESYFRKCFSMKTFFQNKSSILKCEISKYKNVFCYSIFLEELFAAFLFPHFIFHETIITKQVAKSMPQCQRRLSSLNSINKLGICHSMLQMPVKFQNRERGIEFCRSRNQYLFKGQVRLRHFLGQALRPRVRLSYDTFWAERCGQDKLEGRALRPLVLHF